MSESNVASACFFIRSTCTLNMPMDAHAEHRWVQYPMPHTLQNLIILILSYYPVLCS